MKIRNAMIIASILFTALLFQQGCEPPTEAETTGDIEGIIYDASSSQPLQGATVTTEPKTSSKITDASGAFLIEGVEPGNYQVQAAKTGFNTGEINVTIVAGKTASADLQLTKVSPVLALNVTSLDFGETATTKPFTISNTATGTTLDWSVTENASWISVNPASGSITSNSASVTVTVDRTGLNPGNYTETITVSSNGGSETMEVKMTVQGPLLVLSNNSLNFGTSASSMTFTVKNGGIGTISYNTVYSASWLSVNPASGTATTETDVITVTVNRTGMSYGNHFETITVTSNGNNGTVDVMMTVADPNNPQLSAYPTTLDFGETETSKGLTIANSGSGTLTWNLVSNNAFISVTPATGNTGTAAPSNVTVTVNRLGLTPGAYSGTLSVNSDGGNQTIAVSLTVPNTPSLSVTPKTLDFGTDQNSKTITIANAGTGELSWTVSDNQDWITLSPESGTNLGTVNVSVNRTGLSTGTHTGVISVSSNGGTDAVQVSLEIPADDPPTAAVLSNPTEITKTSMKLSWSRNYDDDFASYKLYRASNEAVTQNSTLVTTITSSSTNSYTNEGLSPATTYYYRVYTMDESQQTTPSNVVYATTSAELKTWRSFHDLGDMVLRDVAILNTNYAIAVGDDGAIFYYDGSSWTQETSPTTYDIYQVKILSQTNVWARSESVVIHYDGINWAKLSGTPSEFGGYDSKILSMEILGEKIWIGSSYGKIYHYNGSSWSDISLNVSSIMDIQALADNDVWAVDAYGKILHYDGISWAIWNDGPGAESAYGSEKFKVYSSSDIWVFGEKSEGNNTYGYGYHWNGSVWSANLSLNSTDHGYYYDEYSIYGAYFSSTSDIWTAITYSSYSSSYNKLYHYDGTSFTEQPTPTNNAIYGIYMLNASFGMAVGYDGTVLIYY
jgi:hypothetical protein